MKHYNNTMFIAITTCKEDLVRSRYQNRNFVCECVGLILHSGQVHQEMHLRKLGRKICVSGWVEWLWTVTEDPIRTKNRSRKEVDGLTTVLDHFRTKITLFTYHGLRRKRR